jgi:carbon monoxide dehydrogenase subunit G
VSGYGHQGSQQGSDMELQGSVTIPAAPEQVWHALNDPEVLRLCIPGCEEIRQISAQEMHARLMLKMGPVRANFVGKVLLTDVRPPLGYTLNFEGSGGSAGFARGSSVIALTATADGTQLDYTAQASVAGKLGQIGGRLMDASARQLADRFFTAFKAHLTESAAGGRQIAIAPTATSERFPVIAQPASSNASSPGATWFENEKPRLMWFAAGVVSTAIGVWMGAHWLR